MTGRLAVVAVLVLVACAACRPDATKGTMPPANANGEVDPGRVPDFIAVAGRDDGIAGYVPRRFLLPDPSSAPVSADEAWPVYAADLQTLVGHMVPDRGFVPLGVDPATIPTFDAVAGPSSVAGASPSGATTIYVRNSTDSTRWIALLVDGRAAPPESGFEPGIWVACMSILGVAQIALFDRDPTDAGARILQVVQLQGDSANPAPVWIDFDRSTPAVIGGGVPAWWSGPPQVC